MCTTKCRFDAILLVKKYDKSSVELKPTIVKYAMKHKGKIAMKKVENIFLKD